MTKPRYVVQVLSYTRTFERDAAGNCIWDKPIREEYTVPTYVKLGGGITEDLSEAEVTGGASKRWEYNNYKLVPIEIVIVDDTPTNT